MHGHISVKIPTKNAPVAHARYGHIANALQEHIYVVIALQITLVIKDPIDSPFHPSLSATRFSAPYDNNVVIISAETYPLIVQGLYSGIRHQFLLVKITMKFPFFRFLELRMNSTASIYPM